MISPQLKASREQGEGSNPKLLFAALQGFFEQKGEPVDGSRSVRESANNHQRNNKNGGSVVSDELFTWQPEEEEEREADEEVDPPNRATCGQSEIAVTSALDFEE